MLKSILKSPIGLAVTAGVLILALSPEARKAARKLAVRGTEMVLNASDQMKSYSGRLETNPQDARDFKEK